MSKCFVLLWMIFMHIVDDYYLQGWLASAKQKSWWEKNAPDKMYEHDYIWALIMHSFSWSFMIMLPIAVYLSFTINFKFLIMFAINTVIHAIVDNGKANWKIINLWQDQCIHMAFIVCTFLLVYV